MGLQESALLKRTIPRVAARVADAPTNEALRLAIDARRLNIGESDFTAIQDRMRQLGVDLGQFDAAVDALSSSR